MNTIVQTGGSKHSLVDLISNEYHFEIRKNIAAIYDLANKLFSKHCEKHPELSKLVEMLFLFFDDLLFHLKKEEQILFPNIIQLFEKKLHEGAFNYSSFGIIKEYVSVMQKEHRDIVKQLERFRQVTNNYNPPADGNKLLAPLYEKLKNFDKEMIEHIWLENNCLFPRAIRLDDF